MRRALPPHHQRHQHHRSQRIDTHQRIAHQRRQHDDAHRQPQAPFPVGEGGGQGFPESPQQCRSRRYAQCCHIEEAAQLNDIYPVSQLHVRQQQDGHGDHRQHKPSLRNAERLLRQPHQQQPHATQHDDTQPGIIEMLAQPRAHIRQHAARHHHLLLEKQRRVQKYVVLLHLPKQVGFPEQ